MSEEVNAMVLPYVGSQLVIPNAWAGKHVPGQVVTTIDTSTPAGKLKVMNLMLDKSDGLNDMTEMEFFVSDVTIFTKMVTSEETGEHVPLLHIVLSGPNGTALSTSSPYVLGDLNKISGFFRPLPWNPPMRLIAHKKKSAKGRMYLNLSVVEG